MRSADELTRSTDRSAEPLGCAQHWQGDGAANGNGGLIPGGDGLGFRGELHPLTADGIPALFLRPTTVYARGAGGYIAAAQTYGRVHMLVHVVEQEVPHDPHRGTGGAFWRMTDGARAGWLVARGDPALSVLGGVNA